VASGTPAGVATRDLVTLPYPTAFAFGRAARTPSPFVWLTHRMLVVQWHDGDRRRTLLWEPSDHVRGVYTPYFARLVRRNPLPQSLLSTVHGTVTGHLQALGIDPDEVDYLAFDHLHAQDLRRLLGTTRPAPDLGSPDSPVTGWFPTARLLVQRQEWDSLAHLHPMQVAWYQPETFRDLPADRIATIDGDVHLAPGVALIATPGRSAGHTSLVLHTDSGVWVSSSNGVAAECWAPAASRILGVRAWAAEWGQEVVPNANPLEFASWQYNSMVAESLVADRTDDGLFPQCFPSSELAAHPLSPGTAPTHVHAVVKHGLVTGSPVRLHPNPGSGSTADGQ
jgi:hypothetical protein